MSARRSDRALRARLRGDDGFTLLEVLVAFTVMAVLLAVLFRGVVIVRAGSNAFDDRTQVELVARALLDDALAQRTMRNGSYSGTRDGRRWTIVAKPVDLSGQLPRPPDDPQSKPPPGVPSKPTWMTQRLVVSVATGAKPVEVETIRLVKAEPPR